MQTHAILKHIYKVIYILQPNRKCPIDKPLALCNPGAATSVAEDVRAFGEGRVASWNRAPLTTAKLG